MSDLVISRPAPFVPPEVDPTAEILKALQTATVKPTFVAQAVWDVAQEFAEHGGDLDTRMDVALLTEQEVAIRNNPDLDELTKHKLLIKLGDQRSKAKALHLKVLKEKRDVITATQFHGFLGDVGRILANHVTPEQLIRIGSELSTLISRHFGKNG